jgi:hypothetical protein
MVATRKKLKARPYDEHSGSEYDPGDDIRATSPFLTDVNTPEPHSETDHEDEQALVMATPMKLKAPETITTGAEVQQYEYLLLSELRPLLECPHCHKTGTSNSKGGAGRNKTNGIQRRYTYCKNCNTTRSVYDLLKANNYLSQLNHIDRLNAQLLEIKAAQPAEFAVVIDDKAKPAKDSKTTTLKGKEHAEPRTDYTELLNRLKFLETQVETIQRENRGLQESNTSLHAELAAMKAGRPLYAHAMKSPVPPNAHMNGTEWPALPEPLPAPNGMPATPVEAPAQLTETKLVQMSAGGTAVIDRRKPSQPVPKRKEWKPLAGIFAPRPVRPPLEVVKLYSNLSLPKQAWTDHKSVLRIIYKTIDLLGIKGDVFRFSLIGRSALEWYIRAPNLDHFKGVMATNGWQLHSMEEFMESVPESNTSSDAVELATTRRLARLLRTCHIEAFQDTVCQGHTERVVEAAKRILQAELEAKAPAKPSSNAPSLTATSQQ